MTSSVSTFQQNEEAGSLLCIQWMRWPPFLSVVQCKESQMSLLPPYNVNVPPRGVLGEAKQAHEQCRITCIHWGLAQIGPWTGHGSTRGCLLQIANISPSPRGYQALWYPGRGNRPLWRLSTSQEPQGGWTVGATRKKTDMAISCFHKIKFLYGFICWHI